LFQQPTRIVQVALDIRLNRRMQRFYFCIPWVGLQQRLY
jgi:hypothetical protein